MALSKSIRKVIAKTLKARKPAAKAKAGKKSVGRLVAAFTGAATPAPIEGLQQLAPQSQTTPVASRADIEARALDWIQRRNALQALGEFNQ